ncbi:TolC family protein [Elizabethkingia anophelis]|uniref:TolC family protein n=1 Tax=Elizabethkingia anophelis TaxID=1117645 RepID=UPI003891222F
MRKCFFIILILFSVQSKVHAQKIFGLKDCILYGLENHRSVVIKNNEKGIAKAATKEVRAGYLPSISLNAGIDDNLKVQEQILPAGLFGDKDMKVAFTKQYTTSGTIQLDQKIYDPALIISLKTNKFNLKKSELDADINDEEVIYNITSSYYQIMVYQHQKNFLTQNQDIYKEQVRIAKLQVDKGVLAEVELYKLQVSYNNTISQLRLCEKNISNSTNILKDAMGFPIENDLNVKTNSFKENTQPYLIPQEEKFVVEKRTDYQLAQVDAAIQEMEYKKIRSGYLPTFTFYAKYGLNGFGDKLVESFNSLNDFSSIGVKLSVPIFDGLSRRSQIQQAKLKYQNTLETLKLDESKFKMESENAKTKLAEAQTSIDEETENVALAEKVLEITGLQYKKGIVDMTEWLNAQSSLKESQNNFLNSIVNWYVAKVDLEKANGTIKTFYNDLN